MTILATSSSGLDAQTRAALLAEMARWAERRDGRRLRVVVAGGLGDCLLHTPFLRYFRNVERYESIECVVATETLPLFQGNPHIDRLIGCESAALALWALPEPGCDVFAPYLHVEEAAPSEPFPVRCWPGWVRDPRYEHLPMVRQVAAQFGIPLADERLEVVPDPAAAAWAADVVARAGSRPVVLVNTETSRWWKRYPTPAWQRVVDALTGETALLGLIAATELRGVERIAPVPTLSRTIALCAAAACVVTVDSLLGHVAAALGMPAVVVFGPSDPRKFGHSSNRNLRSDECPPCGEPLERGCGRPRCLEGLPPDRVVRLVRSVLAMPRVPAWAHLSRRAAAR